MIPETIENGESRECAMSALCVWWKCVGDGTEAVIAVHVLDLCGTGDPTESVMAMCLPASHSKVSETVKKRQQRSNVLLSVLVSQSLMKEVKEREPEIDRINEEVNSMLNSAPSGSLQELARSLMKLNSVWGDVTQRIDRYTMLYDTSESQWREFKGILMQ